MLYNEMQIAFYAYKIGVALHISIIKVLYNVRLQRAGYLVLSMHSHLSVCIRYFSRATFSHPTVGPVCASENEAYAELNQLIQSNHMSSCIGWVISMGANLRDDTAIEMLQDELSGILPSLGVDPIFDKAGKTTFSGPHISVCYDYVASGDLWKYGKCV